MVFVYLFFLREFHRFFLQKISFWPKYQNNFKLWFFWILNFSEKVENNFKPLSLIWNHVLIQYFSQKLIFWKIILKSVQFFNKVFFFPKGTISFSIFFFVFSINNSYLCQIYAFFFFFFSKHSSENFLLN